MWVPKLEEKHVRYRAIVEALASDIERGTLRAGDQLPPQRELAYKLGVNLSTISRAYQEAARRRLIGGEVGRGTYVLASSSEAKLFALKSKTLRAIDLSTNIPATMPGDRSFVAAAADLSPEEQIEAGRYHSPHLLQRTRDAIEGWLAYRGLPERPGMIVPCAGAQAALQALLVEKTRPGDPILVESFTFPGMKVIARQLQLRLVSVDQDEEGVLPEALALAARGSSARLAVLVPNLQNPTGAIMGDRRRAAIAAVVAEQNLLVIEDDVYGPLTDRPPLVRDLGDRGILISSLSKTVMPGLRFGFVAGSQENLEALSNDLHFTSWLMSPLAMMIGCRWIGDGTARARAEWQRREIAERWKIMAETLGPSGRPPAPHAWLKVDGDPEDAVRHCRSLGVEVVSANLFAASRKSASRIRICLTAASTQLELRAALVCLAEVGARP